MNIDGVKKMLLSNLADLDRMARQSYKFTTITKYIPPWRRENHEQIMWGFLLKQEEIKDSLEIIKAGEQALQTPSKPDKQGKAKNEYRYCILPGGNAPEFPSLDAECARRGIDLEYTPTKSGGRIYRVHKKDFKKLPKDKEGVYFGDDNSGHSLSTSMSDEFANYLCGNLSDVVFWKKATKGEKS